MLLSMDTITLSLSPEIHCEATAAGDDLPTRFSGVAYSGGLIPQFGAFGDAAIDLSTLQPADKLFALVNHDPGQRAGHGRVWIENQQLHIEGQFARSTEIGRQIAAEFKDGAPWQLSVGLQSKPVHPGKPIEVNGQSLSVKTLFANASVREVSFVPVGADPHTHVAAFAADFTEDDDLTSELETKLAELQAQNSALAESLATEKAAREAAENALAGVMAQARLSAIQALFAELGRDYSDEAAKPYQTLSDDAFALLSADLRSVKAVKLDPALTKEVAVAGASAPDLVQLNAHLMAQVAGRKEQK